MPRKASPPVEIIVPIGPPTPGEQQFMDEQAGARRLETQAMDNATALADRLGYEGAVTVGALEDEIRLQMRRTVNECLELGKMLLLLKELTGHGDFLARLDQLQISNRLAQQFMAATLKFSNTKPASLLRAAGNQSKLIELLVLDPCEIEALEKGESARGLKLDDIESLSRNELRAALKEARETAEARSEVIGNKEARINALEEANTKLKRRLEAQTPDEIGAQLREETAQAAYGAELIIRGALHQAFQALHDHADAHDCTHENFMSGCLAQIEGALLTLRGKYNVRLVPDADERPDWVKDTRTNEEIAADLEKSPAVVAFRQRMAAGKAEK